MSSPSVMRRCRAWSVILLLLLAASRSVAGAPPVLTPPPDRPVQVAVVLTEGATVIDFAGPWEVFQDVVVGSGADERDGFELTTVGASREPVHGSGGLMLVPEWTFADAPLPDVVLVGAQRGAPGLTEWLQKVAQQKRVVLSVCTGAFKVAAAGLLDGKPATTHHDFWDELARQFPKVKVERRERFVQSDDRTFTAGGLTSGIDLALHVVELYYGREVAERTARYMEYQGKGWAR